MNLKQAQQIVKKLDSGGKIVAIQPLTGGVSAQVTAITAQTAAGIEKRFVVRQHGATDHGDNPNIARDEHRLLTILHHMALPVPQSYLADASCSILETPYIVTEFIAGETIFAPDDLDAFLRQSSRFLADLHHAPIHTPDLTFMQRRSEALTNVAYYNLVPTIQPPHQKNEAVILHGDFWPGNMLWQGDQLAAVIDWEDASFGDPLRDLAGARLEIVWAFGEEAAQTFTTYYQHHMPHLDYGNLPYWEMFMALRNVHTVDAWCPDDERKAQMHAARDRFFHKALSTYKKRITENR